MRALQSIYAWTGIVLIILLMLPTMAIVRLFDRSQGRYITGRVFRAMGSWMTRVNPVWKIERTGTLPENPRHPYVVVCNHQSNADIPVISRLPWDMKWVAKAALFQIPVVGTLMRMSEDIPVDRNDPESRSAVVRRAKAALANRVSVMFMPEGTRSRDSRVLRYQDGAFRLAVETGTPVLPLAIDGTSEALPKHGWQYGHAEVHLHVFDPVETTGLTMADVPALRETVRQRTIEQIAAWRGVSPDEVDAAPEQRAALAPLGRAGNPTGEDEAKSGALRV
ncbi:MAG TPA: 1-acyl-sn-glycerol-3-phosphate acyltransferase [Bacteroidetes bacterium]|nr:1-acyl-sn-glycerol-3-phosphate acyltransferase [Bacteroidota bacterium]HIL58273.1 1-acyl-sn-glycerol-3-phosphate acyltransferase [Rhodothermales bacterium]